MNTVTYVIRTFFTLAIVITLAGCSGSSSSDNPTPAPSGTQQPSTGSETPVTGTDPVTSTPTGSTTGGPVEPSGTTAGVWVGPTDFGTGVYIIDSAQNLFGFSSDGQGKFKSLFGSIDSPLERFDHRVGDNPAIGDAPTIVGDPDGEFASLSYLFEITEDGRSLFNTSALGEFTMALADDNSITVADVAGNWESKTSFCDTCPLELNLSITADGTLSGQTSFGDQGELDPSNEIPLSGSVSGDGQYLQIEFTWDGKVRSGVLYREFGTDKLMLNTVGIESAELGNRAFSALLTRSSTGATPVTTEPTPTTPNTDSISATGTWTGSTDSGTGIYIIDAENNLFGLSTDGAGNYKSLFGPIDGLIERFDHRTSDNLALGDAFTIVGDPDLQFANLLYTFTLSEDGNSLTNTSTLGEFTMAATTDNAITIADAVGNWESKTSFCDTCPLVLSMTIGADGGISGSTVFGLEGTVDPANTLPLTGTLTEAGQYLAVSFNWDGKIRNGVVYRDVGTQKLIINTVGVESAADGNRAFSALLTQLP